MGKLKKRNRTFLDARQVEKMRLLLKPRGSKTQLARKLGIANETITHWINTNNFPTYCALILENRKLEREIKSQLEANNKLKKMIGLALNLEGDDDN